MCPYANVTEDDGNPTDNDDERADHQLYRSHPLASYVTYEANKCHKEYDFVPVSSLSLIQQQCFNVFVSDHK